MKTPRALLLARHRAAEPALDQLRREVLAATAAPSHRAALPPTPGVSGFGRLWRELFLVCRPAWAALAAVWVVALGLHLAAADWSGAPAASALAAVPAGQDTLAVLHEQQQFLAQLLDLAPTGAPALAPRPGRRGKAQPPGPSFEMNFPYSVSNRSFRLTL